MPDLPTGNLPNLEILTTTLVSKFTQLHCRKSYHEKTFHPS